MNDIHRQIEKHFPGGVKEIIFPDSTRKVIGVDGVQVCKLRGCDQLMFTDLCSYCTVLQECYFPDGIVLREYPDGRRAVISQDY